MGVGKCEVEIFYFWGGVFGEGGVQWVDFMGRVEVILLYGIGRIDLSD